MPFTGPESPEVLKKRIELLPLDMLFNTVSMFEISLNMYLKAAFRQGYPPRHGPSAKQTHEMGKSLRATFHQPIVPLMYFALHSTLY